MHLGRGSHHVMQHTYNQFRFKSFKNYVQYSSNYTNYSMDQSINVTVSTCTYEYIGF